MIHVFHYIHWWSCTIHHILSSQWSCKFITRGWFWQLRQPIHHTQLSSQLNNMRLYLSRSKNCQNNIHSSVSKVSRQFAYQTIEVSMQPPPPFQKKKAKSIDVMPRVHVMICSSQSETQIHEEEVIYRVKPNKHPR